MQIKFTLKLKIPTRFPQHDLLSGCSHGWEKSPYEGKWPFGYDICKCKWRKKHHRTLNWKVLNWGGGEGIQGGIDEQHPGNMIHWAQMLLLYGKIFFFFFLAYSPIRSFLQPKGISLTVTAPTTNDTDDLGHRTDQRTEALGLVMGVGRCRYGHREPELGNLGKQCVWGGY